MVTLTLSLTLTLTRRTCGGSWRVTRSYERARGLTPCVQLSFATSLHPPCWQPAAVSAVVVWVVVVWVVVATAVVVWVVVASAAVAAMVASAAVQVWRWRRALSARCSPPVLLTWARRNPSAPSASSQRCDTLSLPCTPTPRRARQWRLHLPLPPPPSLPHPFLPGPLVSARVTVAASCVEGPRPGQLYLLRLYLLRLHLLRLYLLWLYLLWPGPRLGEPREGHVSRLRVHSPPQVRGAAAERGHRPRPLDAPLHLRRV